MKVRVITAVGINIAFIAISLLVAPASTFAQEASLPSSFGVDLLGGSDSQRFFSQGRLQLEREIQLLHQKKLNQQILKVDEALYSQIHEGIEILEIKELPQSLDSSR